MRFFQTLQSVTGIVFYSMVVNNNKIVTTRYMVDYDVDRIAGFWNDLDYAHTITTLSENEVDSILCDVDVYYEYHILLDNNQLSMFGSFEQIEKIKLMISLGYFE